MGIGPQLPPHLAHLSQRAASPEKSDTGNPSKDAQGEDEEDDPYGPALPPHLRAGRSASTSDGKGADSRAGQRILGSRSPSPIRIGPARPTVSVAAAGPSRPLAAGPARPGSSLDSPSPPRLAAPTSASRARPAPAPAQDDSDGEEIGPSLGMLSGAAAAPAKSAAEEFREREKRIARAKAGKNPDGSDEGPKRQEWMLVPPESGPLAHVDPLRKRPTTFSRSTADPSASGGIDRSWTETPAERRQRVADEMAGIKRQEPALAKKPGQGGSDFGTKRRRDDEIRAEVERYSKSSRGESLLDKHTAGKAAKKDKEEPPMIWDHARDMGVTGRLLSNEERQAKIKDARGLNDRFGHSSSGAYQI